LNDKIVKAAEEDEEDGADAVREEFKEWKGGEFARLLDSKPQSISSIEPGGFRYFTVPNDWAKNGELFI
jgi:hypothetical protein